MNSALNFLQNFIKEIRKFNNIKRKEVVFPLMDKVRENSFSSLNVFRGMGEDSAAVLLNPSDPSEDTLVLITTDGIDEDFSTKLPWSAGFCAIMVCIDDIYACGGEAIAASCIISSDDPKKRDELMKGILDATHRFKVPLVRGHTAENSKNVGVSATIIGKIKKEDYISAGAAEPDDIVMIVADFDGKVGKSNKYHWDTITFKNSDELLKKRSVMNSIASLHLAHASKDISNGGIFGTLILMLQYSQVGAEINLELIKLPKLLVEMDYSELDFSKMFLTTAFLLAIPKKNCEKVSGLCKEHDMIGIQIGSITESKMLTFTYKGERAELVNIEDFIHEKK